jgi:hypothetical protein
MCLYEAVVGREVEKVGQEGLRYEELVELQADLSPLVSLLTEQRPNPPLPARQMIARKQLVNKGV